MKQRVWFERLFEVGVPRDSYPELVERLRGTPARLDERVRDVARSALSIRSGDAWSVQEHVGHLSDLETLWLGRIEDLLARDTRLREADLTNAATWDASHNDDSIDSILKEFRGRRAKLVLTLESLKAADLERTALHPRLGQPMTVVDLSFFVAEHDDHHMATITTLLSAAD